MQKFELGNFLNNKQHLEQKLAAIIRLKDKLTSMSSKLTYRGYQRVNSVMFRNVEIKHTSEFMIKLNNQYFAQVKTHTALENLQRKKINYQQQLKQVDYKVQLLEKKIKKSENKKKDHDFLDKYDKSTVEVIGTNEEGESIFNIIEVEGEGDNDIGEWKQKASKNIKQKDIKKEQKKAQQKPITSQQTTTNQNDSPEKLQVEGEQDFNFDVISSQDQDSLSDIDEDQQEEEHQKQQVKKKVVENKKQEQKIIQSQKMMSQQREKIKESQIVNEKQSKAVEKQPQTRKLTLKQATLTPQKSSVQKKPTTTQKPKQSEPTAKPISKFKLERMKQKLQQNQ